MGDKALYNEIYDKILMHIKDGTYPEGTLLPSEREMCGLYHVSRSTIRLALIYLENEGYIYKVQGRGTFVKPRMYEQKLLKFYSFTEELKNSNILIHNDIVDYELVPLGIKLAGKLDRKENEVFHKITRLRSASNSPLMLETTYLPQSRFFNIDIDTLRGESLYNYLTKNYNARLEKAVETFKPVLPKSHESELLSISGKTPCMLLERYTYEKNYIIEYTISIVRGDKFTFKVNLSS